MGTNFNPDIILEVAERLKEYKNIEFQMIGQGVRNVTLKMLKARTKNIIVLSFTTTKTWYRMCTVLVLFVLFH